MVIFASYGEPAEQNEDDYLYFEKQRVLYVAEEVFGPSVERLDIRFVQFQPDGAPLLPNCTRLSAYFDENNSLVKNDPESGLVYSIAPSYMNPDGTFQYGPEYDFSLRMRHPELVEQGVVTLEIYMHSGDFFEVPLKYNDATGVFDGVLKLESNAWTPETLMESYVFRYGTAESGELGFTPQEDDPSLIASIYSAYEKLSDLDGVIDSLRDEYPGVEEEVLEAFLGILSDNAVLEEDTQEAVDTIRAVVGVNNELHDAVERYAETVAAIQTEAALLDVEGAIAMQNGVGGMIHSMRKASYSAEYLAEHGYLKQTADAMTVYLLCEEGRALVYCPDEGVEVELAFDAEETAALLSSPHPWQELDDDSPEFTFVYASAAKLNTYVGYVKTLITATCAFFDVVIKSAETLKTYEGLIESTKDKIKGVGAKIDDLIDEALLSGNVDIAFDKIWNKATDELADKAFGKQYYDQELAKLKLRRAELQAHLGDLDNVRAEMAAISKTGPKLYKNLTMGAKFTTFAANVADKVANSPLLGAAFAAIDMISCSVDLGSSLSTLCGEIQANLRVVETIYELYSSSDSAKCRESCIRMRQLLAIYRMNYKEKFFVACGKAIMAIAGDVLSCAGVLSGKNGLVYAICSFTIGEYYDAAVTFNKIPLEKMIDAQWEEVYSACDSDDKDHGKKHPTPSKKYIDPSGFVYEAVASNRLEGVTVTAYYKGEGGNPALWDASDSEQSNPLVTGADGVYEWNTPSGDWLVMAEKEGYIQASSMGDPAAVDGWLPVPPPQMNVNIGMVSLSAPEVSEVAFSGDTIRVLFSQYMDIAALESHPAYVTVTVNGQPINAEFAFIDREASPRDGSVYYGRTLYITPAEGFAFNGSVEVGVDGDLVNHAGTAIGADYHSGALTATQIPGSIVHSYPNRLVTNVGDETELAVRLLDTNGRAMAGRTVTVRASFDLYELPASAVTDENGRAVFDAVSLRSGSDALVFTCEDAAVTLNTYVNPVGTEKPAKPTANLSDYQSVESGTQLVLSCATAGAVIRYTLDDACPCDEDALVYTGPITITGDAFIRIAAWTEEGGYSERLNLHILCAAPPIQTRIGGVEFEKHTDGSCGAVVSLTLSDEVASGESVRVLICTYTDSGRFVGSKIETVVKTDKAEYAVSSGFSDPKGEVGSVRVFLLKSASWTPIAESFGLKVN